ncbi:Hypothetical protein POVN_LOCUS522 [uncultured virus]|nr:Hypothetical protein POVN_LOCUS522 [uncultured virus]
MGSFEHEVKLNRLLVMGKLQTESELPIVVLNIRNTGVTAWADFFSAINKVTVANSDSATAVFIDGMALTCSGRQAYYDLWWFASEPNCLYAIDVNDPKFVGMAAAS